MSERKSSGQQIRELMGYTFSALAGDDLPEKLQNDIARDVAKLAGQGDEAPKCPMCDGELSEVTTPDGTTVQFCPACNAKGKR